MADLAGKHGLIVGVANKRSISWAIAQAAAASGARLALTYQSERLEENVRELAASLDNPLLLPCDVSSDQQIADVAAACDREFGGLDFLVLALPHTRQTRGMIGEAELRALPRSAFLLNPARGAIVREEALVQAIRDTASVLFTNIVRSLDFQERLFSFPIPGYDTRFYPT